MRGRATTSILASPALVGAVTVLVVIVAVVLAWNANQGLPFVPTYNVSAEIPGGANVVQGNDVRVGGFRVGQVDKIRPKVAQPGNRAIAVLDMKLDKSIEPLPRDTRVFVRPRSNLGLKYIELTLGRSPANLPAGATIPLSQSKRPIELDEFFSLNNQEFRRNQRRQLKGFGDAFAGRGITINLLIEELVPFVTHLEPVMTTLSDPDTRLGEFFRETRRFSGQIAPVASTYADLFENMATTFEALSRRPDRLQAMIEKSPPTLDAGIRSFRVQRPFLRDSARLWGLLEPVAREFEVSLPKVSDAFETGRPVLHRSPRLYAQTERVFRALRDLVRNPNTLLALKDLTTTLRVATPLVEYVAPFQTVCNYWVYFWTGLSEHISEPVRGGTIQRVHLKSDNRVQDNRMSTSEGDRPVDVPRNQDPQTATTPSGDALQALHSQNYQAAIDADGNADCERGQTGYPDRLITGGRYPPSDATAPDGGAAEGGGNHVVVDSNTPGLAGPTFKGLRHLKDVP